MNEPGTYARAGQRLINTQCKIIVPGQRFPRYARRFSAAACSKQASARVLAAPNLGPTPAFAGWSQVRGQTTEPKKKSQFSGTFSLVAGPGLEAGTSWL